MIKISGKTATSIPIQWSDKEKQSPIAFLITCPWCNHTQWISISKLYIGIDNSKKNHQCRQCKKGTEPRSGWKNKQLKIEDVFKPKCPGWRSVQHTYIK